MAKAERIVIQIPSPVRTKTAACSLSLRPPKTAEGRRACTAPGQTTTTTGLGNQTKAAGAACMSPGPLHRVLSSPGVDTSIASALQWKAMLRSRGTLHGHHGGPSHGPPKQ